MLAPDAKKRRGHTSKMAMDTTGKTTKPPLFKNIAKMAMGGGRKRGLDASEYELMEESTSLSSDGRLDETSMSAKSSCLNASSVSKRSRMAKMTSFVSTPVAKVGHALQRSVSSARLSSPSPRRPPTTTTTTAETATTPLSSPSKPFWRSVSHAVLNSPSNKRSVGSSNQDQQIGASAFKRGGFNRSSNSKLTPYKAPAPTPQKERPTRFWSTEFPDSAASLSRRAINLQEAIFELMVGEDHLVKDLLLMRKIYADSMLQLNILSQQEVDELFSRLFNLIPVHECFLNSLRSSQDLSSGLFRSCGNAVSKFVDTLNAPYVKYCSNLISSQLFLEHRRESDKDLSDFLHRCIDSPFSRKLDLAAHLDCPRAKLAKYPLLIRQILKYIEDDSRSERQLLESSLISLNTTLLMVDKAMASAKCRLTLSRLEWLDDDEGHEAVNEAKEAIMEGVLRNSRGTKLECHLLDTVLILCRPSSRGLSRGSVKRLQVYRTPIPVSQLVVDDLGGDVVSASGSVKSIDSDSISISSNKQGHNGITLSGSSHSGKGKQAFRVSFRTDPDEYNEEGGSFESKGSKASIGTTNSNKKQRKQSCHTLITSDEHSKKLWVSTIRRLTLQATQEKTEGSDGIKIAPVITKTTATVEDDESMKRSVGSNSSLSSSASLSSSSSAVVNTRSAFKRIGSPRLKAALNESQSVPHLHRGAVVRRIRNIASTSAINNTKALAALPPKPYINKSNKQSYSANKKRNRKPYNTGLKRSLHTKQRTKSLEVLNDEASATNSSLSMPRYMTRSQTKLSKSLSDLVAEHK